MMKLTTLLKIWIPGLICMFFMQSLPAQTSIRASIDSTMILIGEQTVVRLDVVTEKGTPVELPVIRDTLAGGVWVLEQSKPDTLPADNNRIQIKQDFLITSFDSALYVLPPFQVVSRNDTLLSNKLVLKVVTYPDIDPEKGFYDIKEVMRPQFVLGDYLLYIWIVLISFFLLSTIMYIVRKRKRSEPIINFKPVRPKLPPHLEAIDRLDKIKQEKIWQYGRNKEYYTEITEVLRVYITERFGVNALEMTTDEILSNIYRLHEVHSAHETLKKILELADIVKFAKYVPLPSDNEVSILNAYLFVNQTKIEKLPSEEETKEGEMQPVEKIIMEEKHSENK